MATPRKRVSKKPKKKGKVIIRESAKIVKKDSVRNDTLPKAPARMYRDTGANFKVKIRRK